MKLSKWEHEVSGDTPKMAFEKLSPACTPLPTDLDGFIRLYIFENIPNFILEKPLVFDKIRQSIALSLGIQEGDIMLTGSAKLGFSLNPENWLRDYCPSSSDLDFFIISEKLFMELQKDIFEWKSNAHDDKEKKKIAWIEKNSQKGFIDTWHIPIKYPYTNKCNYIMHKACLDINNMADKKIVSENGKSASIRCYKDKISAIIRIKFNIDSALKKFTA